MDSSMLAAWWVVSFSLVMTPGPDWAYTISAGMRDKAIVPAISGTLLGYAAISLVVAAGLGALVATFPSILSALTLVGATCLVWLGGSILARPPVPSVGDVQMSEAWIGWFMRGFAITGTNPKALLLFLALLPQFTRESAPWPVAAQIAVMGIVQIINCIFVYSIVGCCAKSILQTRPKAAHAVSQLSGIAMLIIAAVLFVEQFFVWRGA